MREVSQGGSIIVDSLQANTFFCTLNQDSEAHLASAIHHLIAIDLSAGMDLWRTWQIRLSSGKISWFCFV
jgi:hypothetical protein